MDKQMTAIPNLSIPGADLIDIQVTSGGITSEPCRVSGYLQVAPSSSTRLSQFVFKREVVRRLNQHMDAQGYLPAPRTPYVQYEQGIYTLTIDYRTLGLYDEKDDREKKQLETYSAPNATLSSLPEPILVEILSYLPVSMIDQICGQVTISCIPDLWRQVLIHGYGLQEMEKRVRSRPNYNQKLLDWRSMMLQLDSMPGKHTLKLRSTDLSDPNYVLKLANRAHQSKQDDLFWFLINGLLTE